MRDRLISIGVWHFVWIALLFSEALTVVASLLIKGRIHYDYLATAAVVSTIVASTVVYFISLERKRTAKALREAEAKSRALLETLPDLMFRIKGDGTLIDFTASRDMPTYLPPKEFMGKKLSEIMPPDVALRGMEHIKKALAEREMQVFEYGLSMDGKKRTYEARVVALDGDEAISVVRDITERREAEDELRQSHNLLAAISRAQSEFIADIGAHEIFGGLLENLLSLTKSEYGFIGEIFYTPEGAPYLKTHAITNIAWNDETRAFYNEYSKKGMEFYNLKTLFGAVMETGEAIISNDPAADPRKGGLPEGHPPLNAFLGMPFHKGGRMVGMVGIANRPGGYDRDVIRYLEPFLITCANIIDAHKTERLKRQVQKALSESESFLHSIIDSVSDPIMLIGPDYRVKLMNRAAREQAGGMDEKEVELFCHRVFHHNEMPCGDTDPPCPLKEVKETGRPVTVLHRHYDRDGSERYYEIAASPLLGSYGSFEGIIESARDVTERMEAEEALKESEEKFRGLAEESPSMIFINRKGRIMYANRKCEETLGYGRKELYSPGFDFLNLIAPETQEQVILSYRRHLSGEDVEPCEYTLVTKGGQKIEVLISTRLIAYGGDKAIMGIVTDITNRKRMEAELKKTIAEREMLIKEAHHRVKNNLLTVSSLLRLQSARVEDKEARGMFGESQNRVKSMSMIHERLYQSADLKTLNISEYIRSLAVQLFRSYDVTEAKVRLKTDVPDTSFDIDTMIPCGLILNELISNALKHAFPEDRKGTLEISLAKNEGAYTLSVADTGVGLPEGVDVLRTGSLGMQLVTSLVKQLGGTLDVLTNGKTEFRITFKEKRF